MLGKRPFWETFEGEAFGLFLFGYLNVFALNKIFFSTSNNAFFVFFLRSMLASTSQAGEVGERPSRCSGGEHHPEGRPKGVGRDFGGCRGGLAMCWLCLGGFGGEVNKGAIVMVGRDSSRKC